MLVMQTKLHRPLRHGTIRHAAALECECEWQWPLPFRNVPAADLWDILWAVVLQSVRRRGVLANRAARCRSDATVALPPDAQLHPARRRRAAAAAPRLPHLAGPQRHADILLLLRGGGGPQRLRHASEGPRPRSGTPTCAVGRGHASRLTDSDSGHSEPHLLSLTRIAAPTGRVLHRDREGSHSARDARTGARSCRNEPGACLHLA